MAKFDGAFSRGDFMRRIQRLERQVELLGGARSLEAASIGAGGLRVKGGAVVILDDDGNEAARWATDGLSLTGILRVLAGLIEWEDDTGNTRMRVGEQGTTQHPTAQSVRLVYADDDGNQRTIIGEIVSEDTGAFVGHGLLVQLAGDPAEDLLAVHDGRAFLGSGGEGFVAFVPDGDDEIDLYDAAGNFRATIGPLASGDYGLLLENPDGSDIAEISDGQIALSTPDGSQVVLRITDADGLRVAVDTDAAGVQSGPMTAGPADSAGAGFRQLRIPN